MARAALVLMYVCPYRISTIAVAMTRRFVGNTPPKEFRGHLTVNVSNDGFVYAADRAADRIHVTTKDGKFVKEFVISPPGTKRGETSDRGSAGGVAFSPDRAQRYLYISDIKNNTIWLLNREDGKIVGRLGSMGESGGQFFGLHMIATDSRVTSTQARCSPASGCSGLCPPTVREESCSISYSPAIRRARTAADDRIRRRIAVPSRDSPAAR